MARAIPYRGRRQSARARHPLPEIAALLLILIAVAALGAPGAAGCRRAPDAASPPITDQPGGPGVSPPAALEARIAVVSEPPGAEVILNDKFVGRTPLPDIRLLAGVYRVTVEAGESSWVVDVVASAARAEVIYVDARKPAVKDFRRYTVNVDPPDATVYLNGIPVGQGPLNLHAPAGRSSIALVADAPGRTPVRVFIPGGSAGLARSVSLSPAAGGPAGPVEIPLEAPTLTWVAQGHATLGLPETERLAAAAPSPDGKLALVVTSGDLQSLVVFDIPATGGPEGTVVSGRSLVTWRTGRIAEMEYGELVDQPLLLGGWRRGGVVFLVPEPDPEDAAPGRLGTGLWLGDASGGGARRLAWLPGWLQGLRIQDAWITGDGQALVAEMPCSDGTAFYVVDLDSGHNRTFVGHPPYYEPSGCTVSHPSPDGWRVAYGPSAGGPAEGKVTILDLTSGQERVAFETPPYGLAENLSWSPNGQLLAIGYAAAGDKHWLEPGEDYTVFYPAKYVVVDLDGNRVAEVAVPGEVLGPSLVWSPSGERVAVTTVALVPAEQAGDPANKLRLGPGRKVYTGQLAQTLSRATPESGNAMPTYLYGWVGEEALVIGYGQEKATIALLDLHTGRRADLGGYRPVCAYDSLSGYGGPVSVGGSVLVAPSEQEPQPLGLLAPDGSFRTLASARPHPLSYVLAGRTLVCVDPPGDADVVLLPAD